MRARRRRQRLLFSDFHLIATIESSSFRRRLQSPYFFHDKFKLKGGIWFILYNARGVSEAHSRMQVIWSERVFQITIFSMHSNFKRKFVNMERMTRLQTFFCKGAREMRTMKTLDFPLSLSVQKYLFSNLLSSLRFFG